MDKSYIEKNRAATERLKALAAKLTEDQFGKKVGNDWTVAVALAHLAFWDRRMQFVLDRTEQEGKLVPLDLDMVVNDVLLPAWEAIPGREAARMAVETAQALDKRLESFPPALLEQVGAHNQRWVLRCLHRNEHLDEVDQALA